MVKLSTLLLPSVIHNAAVLCYFWQFRLRLCKGIRDLQGKK